MQVPPVQEITTTETIIRTVPPIAMNPPPPHTTLYFESLQHHFFFLYQPSVSSKYNNILMHAIDEHQHCCFRDPNIHTYVDHNLTFVISDKRNSCDKFCCLDAKYVVYRENSLFAQVRSPQVADCWLPCCCEECINDCTNGSFEVLDAGLNVVLSFRKMGACKGCQTGRKTKYFIEEGVNKLEIGKIRKERNYCC
jgi:hypothetical protein